MTLYDLFHSIPPEVLLASVMEIHEHNDIVANLEMSFLPGVHTAIVPCRYALLLKKMVIALLAEPLTKIPNQ